MRGPLQGWGGVSIRFSLKSVLDALKAELVTIEPTIDGNLRLPPDDRSPNPNWRETERNGDATGWGISRPAEPLGDAIYVTQPGNRPTSPGNPAAGVSLDETFPPRAATFGRQTADPNPSGTTYTVDGEILPGTGPWAYATAKRPKPGSPEGVAVARTQQGFPAGEIGVAYGFGDEKKKMTPASPYAYGTVAEGQGLRFTPPDLSGTDAPFLYVAVTDVNKGDKTGRVHKWVKLDGATPPSVDIPGPYQDDGKKPPDENQTGVGKLPAPAVGQGRPGSRSRAWVHEENGPKGFGIQVARYRFHLFVKTERGVSLWGTPSRQLDITSVREGKVFTFYAPKDLPDEWDWGVGVEIVPANGAPAYYRVGPTRAGGPGRFFPKDRESVSFHGYVEDAAPGRLEYRLYSTEKPDANDPEQDGTSITPPEGAPDEPYGYGIPQMKPGAYKAAVADAVEGYPSEGPLSDPSPKVIVSTGQTLEVRPAPRLGVIPNAEGALRNRTGQPKRWTSTNITTPVTETVEDGVFSYSTATTIAAAAFWSRTGPKYDLPQGTETVLCVVGTLRVSADTAGATEAVLVQYDADGVEIGTLPFTTQKGQPVQLDNTGTRSLPDRGMRFGPGGTALTAGASAVAIRFRPAPSVGGVTQTQWNQRASFENFQVFPYAEALRKFEETPTDPDDAPPADADNVSPASPYPQQTTFGLGPAPSVAGTTVEAVAPLAVTNFSGGVWPAGSSQTRLPTGSTTSVIEADATSPTGTGYRWRVQDENTNSPATIYDERNFTAGQVGADEALAVRVLFRVPPTGRGLPTRGEIAVALIYDQAGKGMALARLTSGGAVRLYRYRADGSVLDFRTVLGGVVPGSLVDLELAVGGGATGNGLIRLSAGVDRPRSATQVYSAQDFSNRRPRGRRAGNARETDSAGRSALWFYSLVDTLGGDVLDRENPSVGAGDLPPDPDAPPKTGGFRLLDVNGEKLNQWWGVIEPGLGFNNGIGPKTLRPIVVIPGQVYTQGLQWRHLLLEPGGTEDPVHQFFVTLKGLGVPDLEIGSPFGPGPDASLVSRIAGPRSGANTTPPSGLAPSSDWAPEDFWHHFTIPQGYTYAHIGPKNDAPAIMVPQEHGFWKGALTTQAARDLQRTYGTALTGTARITLDTRIEADEFTPPVLTAQRLVSFGASHSRPDLTPLAFTARSTNELPYTGWSTETSDPLAVPEAKAFQIAFTLDQPGAEIPSGSIFVETRPLAEPVLLDRFRQPFPGMVIAGDAEAYPFHEANEEPVDNHASSIRTSDEVERLPPMYLLAFTAAAERALRAITANTVLYHEDPFGGLDGLGRIYRIRFYSRLDVESQRMSVRRFGGTRRTRAVVSATPEAEVLEVSQMGEARGI